MRGEVSRPVAGGAARRVAGFTTGRAACSRAGPAARPPAVGTTGASAARLPDPAPSLTPVSRAAPRTAPSARGRVCTATSVRCAVRASTRERTPSASTRTGPPPEGNRCCGGPSAAAARSPHRSPSRNTAPATSASRTARRRAAAHTARAAAPGTAAAGQVDRAFPLRTAEPPGIFTSPRSNGPDPCTQRPRSRKPSVTDGHSCPFSQAGVGSVLRVRYRQRPLLDRRRHHLREQIGGAGERRCAQRGEGGRVLPVIRGRPFVGQGEQ